MYIKECKCCTRKFKHPSKNARYCSQICSDKVQERRKEKIKRRAIRVKSYKNNLEINRFLGRAYNVAHFVADFFLLNKECSLKEDGKCSSEITDLHHIDGNLLNNSPDNLVYLCKHHHALEDQKHGSLNMEKILSDCSSREDAVKHYLERFSSAKLSVK